jgi:hypothetical protein
VSNYIDSMPTRAGDRGWNRGSIAHSWKTSTSKTQCPWNLEGSRKGQKGG